MRLTVRFYQQVRELYSFIYSIVYSFTYPNQQTVMYPTSFSSLVNSFTVRILYLPVYLFTRSFIYSFIYVFVSFFIYSFISLLLHSFTRFFKFIYPNISLTIFNKHSFIHCSFVCSCLQCFFQLCSSVHLCFIICILIHSSVNLLFWLINKRYVLKSSFYPIHT